MQDVIMIKLSLIMVLVGLPLLGILSWYASPEMDNTRVFVEQDYIAINGTIMLSSTKPDLTRASLKTCMEVPLVIFDPVQVTNGQNVEIRGKKEDYKGRLQLVVDELKEVR